MGLINGLAQKEVSPAGQCIVDATCGARSIGEAAILILQQRLKQVMVALIDHDHIGIDVAQLKGRAERRRRHRMMLKHGQATAARDV
jgi:hypothetical protein